MIAIVVYILKGYSALLRPPKFLSYLFYCKPLPKPFPRAPNTPIPTKPKEKVWVRVSTIGKER